MFFGPKEIFVSLRRSCSQFTMFVVMLPSLLLLSSDFAAAQQSENTFTGTITHSSEPQLNVNWLYGAYIPKEAPLTSLDLAQRFKLYRRLTFTTPGIYIRTFTFSVFNQATDSPSAWGGGTSGFSKRALSNYTQVFAQNSFVLATDAALGYEARYDRYRGEGGGTWPRIRHAIERNFVTYDSSESTIRPQIGLYVSAFGAGALKTTWYPEESSVWRQGLKGVGTQALYGCFSNLLGEFGEDIKNHFLKNRHDSTD
jgi:hypothetical protein